MILDEIIDNKKKEVAKLDKYLEHQIDGDLPERRDFLIAVGAKGMNLIAEVKAASPSAGKIIEKYDPAKIAREYEKAGAAAISVLTDSKYFSGHIDDIVKVKDAVNIPVLRKDFIIDESQIYESRIAGADAILLIVRILPPADLERFISIAGDLEMDAVVEVHSAIEAQAALDAGAEIIGINNRDLDTLEVDVTTTREVITAIPFLKEKVLVSESGIRSREDIVMLQGSEVNAVLIGESLLKAGEVGKKIKELFAR
jgi:indole-3-glycerol phosphate synthase